MQKEPSNLKIDGFFSIFGSPLRYIMKPNTKYSSSIFSSLKSVFLDTSSMERVFFYEKFTEKFNLDYFKKWARKEHIVLLSPNELKFNNLIHFNSKMEEFIKQYGKPNFAITSDTNRDLETLIYKTKISGLGARCILIFYKKKLVIFNYVFPKLSKQQKVFLLDYTCKKYGNRLDQFNYQMIDANKNSLLIDSESDHLVFNFYAPLKKIKAAFENKPKESKLIRLGEKKDLQTTL